jgi:DNA polymerase-3 subunit alpha
MTVRLSEPAVAEQVAAALEAARGGNGVVRFLVPLASGGEAKVVAGRNFMLDGELAEAITRIAGDDAVDLSAQEPPRLALVG